MELRQLRHLVALAELGSFTAAAAREHIVQSGLSNSVQALERDVDAELYVRGSRPVRLTPAGHALLEPARRALDAARVARAAVHDVQNVITGRLRIGVVPSAQHLVRLTDHVADFAAQHPAVDLHLLQAPARVMVRMVGSAELDCAVIPALPDAPGGVRRTTLAREPLLLVAREDHRLARAATVRVGDLEHERFVDVHADFSARAMVDAALTKAGVTRRVNCEVNEWSMFTDLLAAGMGIGFLPEGLARRATTTSGSRLRIVTIEGLDLERCIQLVLPQPGDLTPAARRFAAYLHSHHQQVAPRSG